MCWVLNFAMGRRSNAGFGSAVIVSLVDLYDILKFNIEKSGKKVVQKGQALFIMVLFGTNW